MSKRMIACDEASFLISYREDNRLGIRRWLQLKMHLLTCHLCRKYVSQIKQLNIAVYRYREGYASETYQHHLTEGAALKIHQEVIKGLNAK